MRVRLPTYPFQRRRCWLDGRGVPSQGATATERPPVADVEASTDGESSPTPSPPTAPVQRPTAAVDAQPASTNQAMDRANAYKTGRYTGTAQRPDYVAPRNEIETIVADIWQTLLGVDRVGIHDNFFSLGGHSLTALQTIARIQESLQVKLKVRNFFETPTVVEIAEAIASLQPDSQQVSEKLRILDELASASKETTESVPCNEVIPMASCEDAVSCSDHRASTGTTSFSLYYFSGDEEMCPGDKYRLIIEGAKFADRHGFEAIWTPERHFHRFGGLYPNPSVLNAALATITNQIKLRAGSVVLPLHHPVRVVEEWALADNLSNGRAGFSIASGFHPNDFVFAPNRYSERRQTTWERIETVQKLWRGEPVTMCDGAGSDFEVQAFPRPVQKELPLWITCGNAVETFERAGTIGANVLTALIGIPLEQLGERIERYRQSLSENGFDPEAGRVTLMIHTYIGDDIESVRERVKVPFTDYLRSHTNLLASMAKSKHANFDPSSIASDDYEELLEMEFDRYFHRAALFGTVDSGAEMVRRLADAGVNELGCLVDFGVEVESVLASLDRLNTLKEQVNAAEREASRSPRSTTSDQAALS